MHHPYDTPITDEGEERAREVAERAPDYVYSNSKLERIKEKKVFLTSRKQFSEKFNNILRNLRKFENVNTRVQFFHIQFENAEKF